MTCTFFGDSSKTKIVVALVSFAIRKLIEKYNVNIFYVGCQGEFDVMVYEILKQMKIEYPQIAYHIALAHMSDEVNCSYAESGIFVSPNSNSNLPRNLAIENCCWWMIESSDYVISYAADKTSDAARFTQIAQLQGKTVIELAN